mgnify:CR=1 FL=1
MWAAALIPGGMLESWLHPISVRIAPRNTSALPRHEVHGAHDPSRHASHDPHAPWEATKAEARLAIERAWALSADRSLRAALVESETERLASAWEAITQQAWALHLIGAWDAAIDEVNDEIKAAWLEAFAPASGAFKALHVDRVVTVVL